MLRSPSEQGWRPMRRAVRLTLYFRKLETLPYDEVKFLPYSVPSTSQVHTYSPWLRVFQMESHYDFEIVKGDEIILKREAILLRNLRAAWPIIYELAASHMRGSQIRVRNARGEFEILIGVRNR